jgi:DNA-binding CsgD family transcriptional regulator
MDQAPPSARGDEAPRLRGRAEELALVQRSIQAALAGRGACISVAAGAGLGKTRLLRTVEDLAAAAGLRVARGGAENGSQLVPLMALVSALSSGAEPLIAREALRALPFSSDDRLWLIQELAGQLEKACAAQPLFITLDDMQWADDASLVALRSLVRMLADLPIVWLLAMRPDQLGAEMHRTLASFEESGGQRIRLGTLSAAAVHDLAADLLEAPPSESLLELADSLGGNPFLLVQLLGGLRAEGRLRVEQGLVTTVGTQLPGRLRDSMRLRLERLSALAGRAAVAAAVLGPRFSLAQVAAVLGVAETALLEPAAELIGEGLVVQDGDRLAFSHDLVREAVVQTLPAPQRRVLERRAVDVLMAEGTAPVEVAARLAASAEPGDRAAVSVLSRAAQTLVGTDARAAAELALHALGLLTENDALRGPLVAQTAVLLHLAGRSVEGVALAQGALHSVLPEEQKAEIYRTIAISTGVPVEIREQACRHGLALSGLPDLIRLQLRVMLGYSLVHIGRTREALDVLPELADGHPRIDDPLAARVLSSARQALAITEDRFADALTYALSFDIGGGLSDATMHMTHTIVESLALQDRFAEAERILGLGLEQAERTEQVLMTHTYERLRGRLWAASGRLPDAVSVLEVLVAPEERTPGNSVEAATLSVLGRLAWQTGQTALARRCAQRAEDVAATMAGEAGQQARVLLAYLRMADSDAAAAHELLLQGAPVLPRFSLDPAHAVELVRVGRASGDADLMREGVEIAEQRAARNPGVESLAGIAAHARGLADGDVTALREAVSVLARGPRRLALASALEDLGSHELGGTALGSRELEGRILEGTALGGHEPGEASVAAWSAAFDLYDELGAVWDAGRVRGRLRGVGVRRSSRGAGEAGAWGGLTAAELDVVRLVARGMTNREVAKELFLSPYTVNSHLRHVFAKLDIRSRVELVRLYLAQVPDGSNE